MTPSGTEGDIQMDQFEKSLRLSIVSPKINKRGENSYMMSLPILSSRFFQEHRPDLGFFSKWASVFAWNERILPVYEWQGVLFIGCLFAPENFPRLGSHKVVWVLCEAGALQDLWLEFQSVQQQSPSLSDMPQAPPQMGAPEGLETDFNLDLTAPLIEDPVLDDITVPIEMEDPAPAANKPLAPAAKPPESQSQAGSSPEDLFALADTEEAKTPEGEPAATEDSLDNGLLDLTGPLDTPAAPGGSPLIALQPLSSLEKDAPSGSDGEINLESTNESAVSAEAEVKRAKPSKSEVILGGDLGDVTRIAQNTLLSTPDEKLEGWMEQIFKDLESKFQKSMILLKKGERVRAWKWDHNFGPSSMVSSGISLIRPSPFRIVARTKKPYHGYVVQSDIADKFFGEWNDYVTPEHMTIAPILVGDHVIGMLLAIGTKVSGDTKEALTLAEKEANSISKHINSSQADKLLAA
jgi:hypothetical protein